MSTSCPNSYWTGRGAVTFTSPLLPRQCPFLNSFSSRRTSARAAAGVWPPAAAFAPWADRAQVPGMRPRVDTTAKTQKRHRTDAEEITHDVFRQSRDQVDDEAENGSFSLDEEAHALPHLRRHQALNERRAGGRPKRRRASRWSARQSSRRSRATGRRQSRRGGR